MKRLMTAAELDIQQFEFNALIETLHVLENNLLIEISEEEELEGRRNRALARLPEGKLGYFHMNYWSDGFFIPSAEGCGTVQCIGGTAEWLGQMKFTSDTMNMLQDLFYPPEVDRECNSFGWDKITTKMASTAVRHFLTTGDCSEEIWRSVIEGELSYS